MLHLDALGPAEFIDAAEPILYTGEQHDASALLHQVLPGEGEVFPLRFPQHGVHVGQNTVDAVLTPEAIGQGPKLRGGHAQRGNEGVVLHIGSAEGLVKIV